MDGSCVGDSSPSVARSDAGRNDSPMNGRGPLAPQVRACIVCSHVQTGSTNRPPCGPGSGSPTRLRRACAARRQTVRRSVLRGSAGHRRYGSCHAPEMGLDSRRMTASHRDGPWPIESPSGGRCGVQVVIKPWSTQFGSSTSAGARDPPTLPLMPARPELAIGRPIAGSARMGGTNVVTAFHLQQRTYTD
jgi:hypothetical protein